MRASNLLIFLMLLILTLMTVNSFANSVICKGVKGPILTNQEIYQKVLQLCGELPDFQENNEELNKCCRSFGCTDEYLKEKSCPVKA